MTAAVTPLHPPAPRPMPILWVDDHHGVYVPRVFAASFANRAIVTGVTPEEWACLEAGPNYEFYWDVWDRVLENARVFAASNIVYTIWQDGPVWLIPDGMEWDEATEFFVWPDQPASAD